MMHDPLNPSPVVVQPSCSRATERDWMRQPATSVGPKRTGVSARLSKGSPEPLPAKANDTLLDRNPARPAAITRGWRVMRCMRHPRCDTAQREAAGSHSIASHPSLLDPRTAQTLNVARKVLGILDVEEAFARQRAREHPLAQHQFCNSARQFCGALQMSER
jgi:hypothetical protein